MKVELHSIPHPLVPSSRDDAVDGRAWIAQLERAFLEALSIGTSSHADLSGDERGPAVVVRAPAAAAALPSDAATANVGSAPRPIASAPINPGRESQSLRARPLSGSIGVSNTGIATRAPLPSAAHAVGTPALTAAAQGRTLGEELAAPIARVEALSDERPLFASVSRRASSSVQPAPSAEAPHPRTMPKAHELPRVALRVGQPVDGEVQIALRDASLSAAQAAVMAQSLAKSITQLGYERARAYVNGAVSTHHPDHTLSGPRPSQDPSSSKRIAPPPTSPV